MGRSHLGNFGTLEVFKCIPVAFCCLRRIPGTCEGAGPDHVRVSESRTLAVRRSGTDRRTRRRRRRRPHHLEFGLSAANTNLVGIRTRRVYICSIFPQVTRSEIRLDTIKSTYLLSYLVWVKMAPCKRARLREAWVLRRRRVETLDIININKY